MQRFAPIDSSLSAHIGIVYRGRALLLRQEVAIKIEPYDIECPQLEYEYFVYRQLAGGTGVPRVHWLGAECNFNVLAMELLGPPVDLPLRRGEHNLSLQDVLHIAEQVVRPISPA